MSNINLFKSIIISLVVLLVIPLLFSACSIGQNKGSGQHVSITLGEVVDIATDTVNDTGGKITVNKPDSSLDGLEIEIPANAYENPVTFTVSESEIKEFKGESEATVISPLITIDNGGTFAEDIIAVTVPITVPEDHFAMAFLYDEANGELEGMPTFSQDDNSLTFLTRHFSPFLLMSIPRNILHELNIDTVFDSTEDAWNLPNIGSYIAPGGYCHGMALTSLYYYQYQLPITQDQLFKYEYDNGLGPDINTRDFWQDDKWAVQLVSTANSLRMTQSGNDLVNMLWRFIKDMDTKSEHGGRSTLDQKNFYLLAFSLLETGEPQLLSIWNNELKSGHALVCYGIRNNVLFVADPNRPLEANLINYDEASNSFRPYSSAENITALQQGRAIEYDKISYSGQSCFYNLAKLEQLWRDYEAGDLDEYFPTYDIWVYEIDDMGDKTDRFGLDILSGHIVSNRIVGFELEAPFTGGLDIYVLDDDGNPKLATSSTNVELTLRPGDNYIGFNVMGLQEDNYWWAGFDWVKFTYDEKEKAEATQFPDFNYCDITVSFDAVYKDVLTGEKHSSPSQGVVFYTYEGTMSGNTFTGTWAEKEGGVTRTGQISVTLDPETCDSLSFNAQETITDDLGTNISSASGGRCAGTCGDADVLVLTHNADDGGWTPTFQDVSAPANPNNPGYAWYEIASSEYIGTTIELAIR